MYSPRKLLAICLCVVSVASIVALVADTSEDYILPDLDGRPHALSAQQGKWLVMNFWASWCAPCVYEMPELQRFYEDNRAIAHVWGVTFEETPVATIREFVEQLQVTYPIVGKQNSPITPFGKVRVLPTTFIIDPQGGFVQRLEGPVTAAQLESIIDEGVPGT